MPAGRARWATPRRTPMTRRAEAQAPFEHPDSRQRTPPPLPDGCQPGRGSRIPSTRAAITQYGVPEFHAEPYVYLAGLSHKSALIAWGAFYFKAHSDGRAKLVDDQDLQWVHPPRCDSIGCTSTPYGPARVEVHDESGALVADGAHQHAQPLRHLRAAAQHALHLHRHREARALGRRASAGTGTRSCRGWCSATASTATSSARCRIRRRRSTGPFSFIVIGDFGAGMRKPSTEKRRQFEVAQALERAVDQYDARLILTTGDNIYASKRFLLWTGDSGDEDDDWFFTYFQPYRYVLNRIPVCPSIGNHDTRETEEHDDREQVMDNMYLRERLAGEEAAGRASVSPGCSTVSASSSRHRVRLHRHVEGGLLPPRTPVRVSEALGLHRAGVPAGVRTGGIRWRIPFGHHPPFCAGPQHHNTRRHGAAACGCSSAAACALLQRPRAQLPALARWTASTTSSRAPAQDPPRRAATGSRRRTPCRGRASATSCSSRSTGDDDRAGDRREPRGRDRGHPAADAVGRTVQGPIMVRSL